MRVLILTTVLILTAGAAYAQQNCNPSTGYCGNLGPSPQDFNPKPVIVIK